MSDRKTSAIISLALCALSSVLLTVWLFTFPVFFRWLLTVCHGAADGTVAGMTIVRFVSIRFYLCSPFAALALYMLIRMLLNMISGRVFIKANVTYLRFISWCCYLVALITAEGGRNYFPLLIVTAGMIMVGTLLRVVKNVMQSALEIKEENDLTV